MRTFVYTSGAIGIGGAVVVDGEVLGGRHGWAGELGHVTVDPQGPACPCGSTGCLELYAGRAHLLRAAGLAETAGPHELLEAVEAEDPIALGAVDRTVQALGVALGGTLNLVDVPTVVLGGHLREIAPVLQEPLETVLGQRVLSARWDPPRVQAATADPAPAARGAALAELERLLDDPGYYMTTTEGRAR